MPDGGASEVLTPLLAGGASGFLGGLGQGLSQQTRQSYGNAAPDLLKSTTGHLNDLWSALATRANQGISLPDAVVGSIPTFTGGGLPMPIGVMQTGPLANGGTGLSLPGLGIDPTNPLIRSTGPPGGPGGPGEDPYGNNPATFSPSPDYGTPPPVPGPGGGARKPTYDPGGGGYYDPSASPTSPIRRLTVAGTPSSPSTQDDITNALAALKLLGANS